jgi:hypothetical protein
MLLNAFAVGLQSRSIYQGLVLAVERVADARSRQLSHYVWCPLRIVTDCGSGLDDSINPAAGRLGIGTDVQIETPCTQCLHVHMAHALSRLGVVPCKEVCNRARCDRHARQMTGELPSRTVATGTYGCAKSTTAFVLFFVVV